MVNNAIIRSARPEDIIKLSILYQQVYIHTYGKEGVSDEFANFITVQFSPHRLEQLIASVSDAIIVAEYKNNLVGVLEIAYDKLCPIDQLTAPELNKIYILDWFCHQGIGQQLMNKAETILREKGYSNVWLWLLESNFRALNFYQKNGFKQIGLAPFKMEVNIYQNIVMAKKL